jgi:hypothetical protein
MTDQKTELVWIRTCQECGHRQKDKEPNRDKELTNAYRDRLCKKCKSEGLDYGSYREMIK